ncbi:MAG TPA: hypothetical protein VG871_06875, partial [Vicinamibacterales bacterium]|nr:hypothetical protein [Vicinamibacterales bacterium]
VIEAGASVSSLHTSYAAQREALTALTPPAASSALVPLLTDEASARILTAFAQGVWRPFGTLVITPGARMVHDDLAQASWLDPRVSAAYGVGRYTTFKGAWNIDHQAVNRLTQEDRQYGDTTFWALSDGTAILVPRVQQVSGGATIAGLGAVFDGRIFYRRLDSLTMFAPRLLPGTAPASNGAGLQTGSGTARGMELAVQDRMRGNSLAAAYTLGRARDTFPGLEANAFPADGDRLHQFTAADVFRIRGGWSANAALVAASGQPVTPATGVQQVWFPTGLFEIQPLYGPRNSSRLPAYHRLDVGGQYAHRFGGVASTLGVTVFNVYNRPNVALYDYDPVGSTVNTTAVPLTSRAVDAFFRIEF